MNINLRWLFCVEGWILGEKNNHPWNFVSPYRDVLVESLSILPQALAVAGNCCYTVSMRAVSNPHLTTDIVLVV
jgi:hypothetical protein